MRIIGVAIGALMIGGAVIALTGTASADGGGNGNGNGGTTTVIKGCMNPNSTNYNDAATEDDGSCVFADEQDQQDYVEDLNEQKRKEEEAKKQELIKILRKNCNDLYNSKGIRQKDSTQKVLELNKTGNTNCHVEELQAIIYTDKEYYIVGEPVTIYIAKRFVEDSFGTPIKQRRWFSQSSYRGESLDFKLGVWDEYAENDGSGATVSLKSWNSALNGASANATTGPVGIIDDNCENSYPPTNGATADDARCFSWQKFTFNTGNLTIAEPLGFTVKAKIYRGSEDSCIGTISQTKDKKRAFTIFPKTCSMTNLKEFGVYEAEQKKENYAAETSHLKQSHHSFIDNWW